MQVQSVNYQLTKPYGVTSNKPVQNASFQSMKINGLEEKQNKPAFKSRPPTTKLQRAGEILFASGAGGVLGATAGAVFFHQAVIGLIIGAVVTPVIAFVVNRLGFDI